MIHKRERFKLLISLTIGVLLTSLTNKTPNYGWMGAITPISKALKVSLWDLVIPMFRPLFPLEKLNFLIFGNTWIANNLLYGIITGLIIFLFLVISAKKTTLFTLISLIPFLFIVADGGVIYDIIFTFSLILLLFCVHKIFYLKSKSLYPLIALGVALLLANLSRPFFILYGLCFLAVFYLYLIKKRQCRKQHLIPFLIFFCFSLPFHVAQYSHTNSIILSNYGGCNLFEGFHIEHLVPLERKLLNTDYYTKICAKEKSLLIKKILQKPQMLLLEGNLFEQIKRVFFPTLRYHGNSKFTSSINHKVDVISEIGIIFILCLSFYYLYLGLRKKDLITFIVGSFVMFYTPLITYAHDGTEIIRMSLPLIFLLFYYSIISRNHLKPLKSKDKHKADI